MEKFNKALPGVLGSLQLQRAQLPMLWSADFIRNADGSYVVSGFNASCVGLADFYCVRGSSLVQMDPEARERGQRVDDRLGWCIVKAISVLDSSGSMGR